MRVIVVFLLVVWGITGYSQSIDLLILKGDYSDQDSIQVTQSYLIAKEAVQHLYDSMLDIWFMSGSKDAIKKNIRIQRWRDNEAFMKWLGAPGKMNRVEQSIRNLHKKFSKPFVLEVIKGDEGRCNRRLAAWAVPYGPVRIRLCRNFLNINSELGAKFLIHEVGHETGMLFHRKIFDCRGALSAVSEDANRAKLNPETYAWLAMSYLGMDCSGFGRRGRR